MFIEITRNEPNNPLGRQSWRFHFRTGLGLDTATLRLEKWERQRRQSPRGRSWTRIGEGYRNRAIAASGYYQGYCLPAKDVPLPAGVVEDAKRAILRNLKVLGPEDPV